MNRRFNVFILSNNIEAAGKQRRYLKKRFGDILNVSIFLNVNRCIGMMNDAVDLVVVDNYLYEWGSSGLHGQELIQRFKSRNHFGEVIVYRSNNEVSHTIIPMLVSDKAHGQFRPKPIQYLSHVFDQAVAQPVKFFVADLGVQKFVKIFFLAFATMFLTFVLTLAYIA